MILDSTLYQTVSRVSLAGVVAVRRARCMHFWGYLAGKRDQYETGTKQPQYYLTTVPGHGMFTSSAARQMGTIAKTLRVDRRSRRDQSRLKWCGSVGWE